MGFQQGQSKIARLFAAFGIFSRHTLQYGLVAEEVARVYPELVTHDTDSRYQMKAALE
jgi:hypothetical protein